MTYLGRRVVSVKLRNPIRIFLRNCVQEIIVWLPVFEFWHDFIYLSLSNILIWTSTCGSVQYKRNIQNIKIQSKSVLGPTKYTHRLVDYNKVSQQDFFVESAHRKSKGVLILRTISHHNTISRHNQKTDTTAQLYRTLSMYSM